MDSVENVFKIELFKRFLPRYCELINIGNTYNFVIKFDNDVLTINGVNINMLYGVGKVSAHLASNPSMGLGEMWLPRCHIEDAPYLAGLNSFLDNIINKLNKKSILDNIANLPFDKLAYSVKISDFVHR